MKTNTVQLNLLHTTVLVEETLSDSPNVTGVLVEETATALTPLYWWKRH